MPPAAGPGWRRAFVVTVTTGRWGSSRFQPNGCWRTGCYPTGPADAPPSRISRPARGAWRSAPSRRPAAPDRQLGDLLRVEVGAAGDGEDTAAALGQRLGERKGLLHGGEPTRHRLAPAQAWAGWREDAKPIAPASIASQTILHMWPISASAASRSAASLPSTYSRSGVCPSVTATFSFGLVRATASSYSGKVSNVQGIPARSASADMPSTFSGVRVIVSRPGGRDAEPAVAYHDRCDAVPRRGERVVPLHLRAVARRPAGAAWSCRRWLGLGNGRGRGVAAALGHRIS